MRGFVCGLMLLVAGSAWAQIPVYPEDLSWAAAKQQQAVNDLRSAERDIERRNGWQRPLPGNPEYDTWRKVNRALRTLRQGHDE